MEQNEQIQISQLTTIETKPLKIIRLQFAGFNKFMYQLNINGENF